MKKKILAILGSVILGCSIMTGCQAITKDFSGNTTFSGNNTLDLPENTKLEEITWRYDKLCYLTRPMNENDVAETYTFNQSNDFGVFEGTLTIIEHKTK